MAWHPYEVPVTDLLNSGDSLELEVVLTRRNTFGPLHQQPAKAGAYGPFSYVTEGDEFSEDYQLLPAGLLKAPVLHLGRHA